MMNMMNKYTPSKRSKLVDKFETNQTKFNKSAQCFEVINYDLKLL